MKSECSLVYPAFKSFEKDLKVYIAKKVGDENLAEDLTNDLFIKLWDTCEKLPDVENTKAWITRMANNLIYDHYRRHAKEIKSRSEEAFQDIEEDPEVNEAVNQCLVSLITQISPKYQQSLILSDVHGNSQKEIAKKLEISYSAVKMRVQRGRKQLKELFKENCAELLEC